MRIAVINGPNLNLLGQREPAIYGVTTLAEIETKLREVARELDVSLSFAQFNGEGDIIDAIHALKGSADGALVNAGAYSPTSPCNPRRLTSVAIPFRGSSPHEHLRARAERDATRCLRARSRSLPDFGAVTMSSHARARDETLHDDDRVPPPTEGAPCGNVSPPRRSTRFSELVCRNPVLTGFSGTSGLLLVTEAGHGCRHGLAL